MESCSASVSHDAEPAAAHSMSARWSWFQLCAARVDVSAKRFVRKTSGAAVGAARTLDVSAMGLLLLLGLLAGMLADASARAADLAVATWNLEHLAASSDDGCRPRSNADYARLRRVAERLDADVVALQEVENAAAVARVFDPDEYLILLSARPGTPADDCRAMPGQAMTALRTGFAVRRARLAELGLVARERSALDAIGLDGLRWGTRLRIEPARKGWWAGWSGDAESGLEILSVHLKAGCHYGALGADHQPKRLRRSQCEVLRRQRGVLEQWIDEQALAGQAFVVAGDFNRQLDQPNDHFWQAIDDGEVCRWEADTALGRRCKPGSSRDHPAMRLRLAGAGRDFPYPLNPRYPYAIDHIVAGGDAADWLVPDSYEVLAFGPGAAPSDHHPVIVRLALPWPHE